ncbi:hypothetical protein R3P38DRAFT_3603684 [Favolaschia claudopus]|uniref:Uncharacterized protein n=1 Tax=Favolaschia claudopus TaxID=2862362 RepID=A0AAW0A9K6_9AGAR
MVSSTFFRLAIFLGLSSYTLAAPLNHLEARANCANGKESPCICNGALGLREVSKTLRSNCANQNFQFKDPSSPTDGNMTLVAGNVGNLHIVELQFIADEISKVPSICTTFQSTAGAAGYNSFFDAINKPPNTIFLDSTVNNAKGIVFGGKSFVDTTQKAANGVISYLTLLKTSGAQAAAQAVDDAMTTAVGAGNGFPAGFETRFTAALTKAITTTTNQIPKLLPAQAAGDPFIDETASTIAKCTRGVWGSVQDFVVRAVTGKPPATAAQCTLPAKPATSAKPAAKPATSAKPAAKPPVKPAAKPSAKPATKPAVKPATKPAVKPATKPAAKPAAKPAPAVKPVSKPVKKPAKKGKL